VKKGRRLLKLVIFSLLISEVIGLALNPFQVSAENEVEINLVDAFPNLSFEKPVDFQYANDGTNRLFVVEKEGVIRVFNNSASTSVATIFLDISSLVRSGGEEGLLGLVFHPDFNNTKFFYAYYTPLDDPHRSVVARYNVSDTNPNQADATSELVLLKIPQPNYSNHKAGQLAFGPDDGYLYIATGDGGGAGDPEGNAQNLTTLLGNILRIDVDNPENEKNYGIPDDNPFVDNVEGYKEEIFAYGLRNPWRFSFDPVKGWLWASDAGQSRREEINIIENGKNYGWNIKEGSLCYNPPSGCDPTGLVDPVWEYDTFSGSVVIGGYVYRGEKFPELDGIYIYGDFKGRIWGLSYDGINPPDNTLLLDSDLIISSFGVDKDNALYILSFDNGHIYVVESLVPDLGDSKSILLLISVIIALAIATRVIYFYIVERKRKVSGL